VLTGLESLRQNMDRLMMNGDFYRIRISNNCELFRKIPSVPVLEVLMRILALRIKRFEVGLRQSCGTMWTNAPQSRDFWRLYREVLIGASSKSL
jgi:hypothetical protein